MHLGPGDQNRVRAACGVGVGDSTIRLGQEHRSPAVHLHQGLVLHDGRRIFVHTHAQQVGAGCDQGEQPPESPPLGEVLVHNHVRQEAQPLREAGHPLFGCLPAGPEGDHVFTDHRGSGTRASDDRAVAIHLRHTLAESRTP